MTNPFNCSSVPLQVLLNKSPKSHHEAIKCAFEIGMRTAQISHANETREALRGLFRVADMDVENAIKEGS